MNSRLVNGYWGNMLTKRQISHIKSYCKDDIRLIPGFNEALADNKHYECHHCLELTLDGHHAKTSAELKRMDMYYNRPYYELKIIEKSEHIAMHKETRDLFPGKRFIKGQTHVYHPLSESGKLKRKLSMTGKRWQTSEFGIKYFEFYGISCSDNPRKYFAARQYYKKHGYFKEEICQ